LATVRNLKKAIEGYTEMRNRFRRGVPQWFLEFQLYKPIRYVLNLNQVSSSPRAMNSRRLLSCVIVMGGLIISGTVFLGSHSQSHVSEPRPEPELSSICSSPVVKDASTYALRSNLTVYDKPRDRYRGRPQHICLRRALIQFREFFSLENLWLDRKYITVSISFFKVCAHVYAFSVELGSRWMECVSVLCMLEVSDV
jgi:hypothetical protein